MQTVNVYQRLTNRYVDSYRHLDRSKFLGTVKLTPPRKVREPREQDAYYDEGTYLLHARAPAGSPDLTGALRSTLTHSGCHHEYDCCGCRSVRANVRKVSARDYVVTYDVSFNY